MSHVDNIKMNDSAEQSFVRQPDSAFHSEEPFQDYTSSAVFSNQSDGCCRLCCNDECDLRELFPGGYKEELLLRKIYDCTTVQIYHSEDSDALICHACVGKIEDFFQYREQCRINDVLVRKWKKRFGRSNISTTSTLLPVVSIKSELEESEYFGPPELVPIDAQSEADVDYAAPIDDSYGNTFGQIEHSTITTAVAAEQEDSSLSQPIPTKYSFENYGIGTIPKCEYRSYEDEPEAEYQIQIKQEPEDIDDSYYDYASMNSGLIPVIEDAPVISGEGSVQLSAEAVDSGDTKHPSKDAAETGRVTSSPVMDDADPGRTATELPSDQKADSYVKHCMFDYKMLKNSKNRTRLYADGHMFVREGTRKDGTKTWRCRKNYDRCGVSAEQHQDGTVDVFGTHDHLIDSLKDWKILSNGTRAYKFAPSTRGHRMLIVDGYRYTKFYARMDGTTLWRCSHTPHCKVKAVLENDGMVYVKSDNAHNHEKSEHPIEPPDTEDNGGIDENSATSKIGDEHAKIKESKEVPVSASGSGSVISPVKYIPKSASVKKKKELDYRIIQNKKGFQALVYKGYRYCKVRIRQDGTTKWLCKMNRKTCNAGLYQRPDGRLEWLNTVRHNHVPTDVDVPLTAEEKNTNGTGRFHIDVDTFVQSEWYYVRNKKNGTTIKHAGYRYNKKGTRSDMSSLWRCSRAQLGCRAAIVMYPNETIAKLNNIDHNHAPPVWGVNDQVIGDSELDTSGEQPNDGNDTATINYKSQSQSKDESHREESGDLLEEQDDPDANMRNLLNFTLGISAEDSVDETNFSVLSKTEAAYRFIRNRRFTQSLLFRGYRYCRNTPRADGSILWVCQMNKKTCKASVKQLPNGSLVLINVKHNHSKLETDAGGGDEDENVIAGDAVENNNTSISMDEKGANSTLLKSPSSEPSSELDRKIQDGSMKLHDYYYAINRSNRECLIFQKCRYSRSNTRMDGSIIWRCMMAAGTCPASAIVHVDGTCSVYRDSKHKHPPLSVIPPVVRYPDVNITHSLSEEDDSTAKTVILKNALMYKQHRFKKSTIFPDGSAQYKCEDAEGCPAIVKLKWEQDCSNPKILRETPHNHGQVPKKGGVGSVSTTRRNSFPGHDGTFQLYKTIRGQLTLIHEGYRYSLRNRQTDGTTSWKCRANKHCRARFYISKAGTMLQTDVKDLLHNHVQNGQTMSMAEPIRVKDDEFSTFDDLVQQCVSKMQTDQTNKLRRPGAAKTMKHGGHTYTLRTVKPSGREHWRCSLFQAKACRAALFCRNNGKTVEHSNALPHTHKPTAGRVLPIRNKSCAAKNTTTTVAIGRANSTDNLGEAGTEDFEFEGRTGKGIAYRGHRYYWSHVNQDGFTHYRCTRHYTDRCSVTIKLDPERKKIFHHSKAAHTHGACLESPTEMESPFVSTSQNDKDILLMLKASTPITDYHFERTARGATLCHDGYHYWSHNKLSCGWMVYRCRMQKRRCLVVGYYNPQDRVFHLRQDALHNHARHYNESERLHEINSRDNQNTSAVVTAGGAEQTDCSARVSDNYSFMRSKKDGKVSLYYRGFLYSFGGKKNAQNGDETCYEYHCSEVGCTACVELLTSDRVCEVRPDHDPHNPHSLENMEDLGRGSKDFRLYETNTGMPVVTFKGYRYYLGRSREDGSSRWYCQSTVANEKRDNRTLRKRCFVPLSMFPNGCVSTLGKHMHPSSIAFDAHAPYLLVNGKRFQFKRKLPNDSSVFRCVEHPACGAVVYRAKNGRVQTNRTAHCHESKKTESSNDLSPPKILNSTTSAATTSPPSVPAGPEHVVREAFGSIPTVSSLPSISMSRFEKTHGRRSFCYEGNRYYFYHTRSDGKQFWRCISRTTDCKCRVGLLRLPGGLIIPHNEEHHSHPDHMPGISDAAIPEPPGLVAESRFDVNPCVKERKSDPGEVKAKTDQPKLELAQQKRSATQKSKEARKVNKRSEKREVNSGKEEGTYDYRILKGSHRSDMFLKQNGLVYNYCSKLSDGGRVFSCKKKYCHFEKLLLANGKLISLSPGEHMCEDIDDQNVSNADTTTSSAKENPFMFPCKTTLEEREIEDPDDFLVSDNRIHDNNDILPDVKRLRLTLHSEPMARKIHDGSYETTDSGYKVAEQQVDPSTSAWLDVEKEEIIDSPFEDNECERSCNNESQQAHPSRSVEREAKERDERKRSTKPLDPSSKSIKDDDKMKATKFKNHSNSRINADDETNSQSGFHSKNRNIALVVSAVPHENYARKSTTDNNLTNDSHTP